MATAQSILERSFRLANILGEGQALPPAMGADGLDTFNSLIDAWGLDSLLLYQTANDSVTTVPGQATYTLGTGGDWTVDRPAQINSAYFDYQGVSYPVREVNQDEYNMITLKGLTGAFIPQFFLYLNTYPLGTLTLWPMPQSAQTFVLSVDRVLTQATSVATDLVFPPGYKRAFVADLACELCPEFGREPSPFLLDMRRSAKADVRKGNHVPVVAEFDPAIVGPAVGGYAAILSGSF